MTSLRTRTAQALALGVATAGLSIPLSPAHAGVDVAVPLPYSQDWSDADLITANDDWSGVPGVAGYLGDDASTTAAGTDPRTVTSDFSTLDVIANQTSTNITNGGVAEFPGYVALQGSGSADYPNLVLRLDLADRTEATTVAFNAVDVDATADNAAQPIAVQYRIGATGAFTAIDGAYNADVTEGPSLSGKSTAFSVVLPEATRAQSAVFVRILTSNASGSDEWVAIDDITVTTGTAASTPLTAGDPGTRNATQGAPITSFDLTASGGTTPYTWTATGLPAGVSVSTSGTVSGTPTESGTFPVTATVRDADGATDDQAFTINVASPAELLTIAQIQGTGSSSPRVDETVTTRGVVTASYPTGGFAGFTIQTAGTGNGTDATPGASDGVFVFAPSLATLPAVGDSVEVTGKVAESRGLTQITGPTVTALSTPLADVTPLDTPWFTTDGEREAHESELIDPNDARFTVTNSYATWQYGEVGLATGNTPLVQPTEVEDFQTGDPDAVAADNARRLVTLDDGRSSNFGGNASGEPSSWMDATHPVRVGAEATLKGAFVVDYRFNLWRLQPTGPVTGLGTHVAEFENTRPINADPVDVPGDFKIATFNVLNYFPTTGDEYVASERGTCTYYNDRHGNPISNKTCSNNGPRGAANTPNFERQQAKIVAAINKLDASIVSLEEIENSVQFGKDRDFALSRLVVALNDAAGAGTWDYVRSPAAEDLPTPEQEDVIRTAFIFKPADVRPVGTSMVLKDEVNFDNAREPLAQAFKKRGAADRDAFGIIVNHFKSKSPGGASGENADTGQGAWNADRIDQANALLAFAEQFRTARDIRAVFLTGDFNSYSEEDPIQVLEQGGFTKVESSTPGEETYSFNGLIGSLDHVLANSAALELVTGADVWGINSPESVAYQYSRYNYNVTDFYRADQFAASDHDPEIVGLAMPATSQARLSLLNINDFHGRIDANTTRFATTVERLRDEEGEDHTLFLSAGDNIGASLFASSVQDDQPTLDVLDALELAGSAVGNHEFDRGFADLTGRVEESADFDYLGANVYRKGTTEPALHEYATYEVDGITVAVIGAVTQETPSLVSPGGISDLDFGDPVVAVNRVATRLSDGDTANGEADVIVAEYHEGAGQNLPDDATCAQEIAADTAFGRIARTTVAAVDVIFTGHTHKEYVCDGPVPGSTHTRPIVQTGSYGERIGQVVLTVDRASDAVETYSARNVARSSTEDLGFPRVAEVKRITDAALAFAAEVGNRPIGRITADITTAFSGGSYVEGRYTGGARDNRAAESTLGDLVANALRDGVADFADPDLGITNPGGLRADLLFAGDTTSNPENTDGVVTFAEANAVLPFNNTVALVDLTGAQLKEVLEQQWQTNPDGTVPSRPYLQLGLSDNVEVTSDPSAPADQRITSIRIDDRPLDPAARYTVSTLSFLAQGGDNFRAFRQATYTDTGLLDAQLWRDYLAASSPLSPDFARQQVDEKDLPERVEPGARYSFTLSKLDLTSLGSPNNSQLVARLVTGDGPVATLGSFPITSGTAAVTLTMPSSIPVGASLVLTAQPSGTRVTVPATPGSTTPAQSPSSTSATAADVSYGQAGSVAVTVSPADAAGTVTVRADSLDLGSATLQGGTATVAIPARSLEPGTYTLTVAYEGSGAVVGSSTTTSLTVRKASSTTSLTLSPSIIEPGGTTTANVSVSASSGLVASGQVEVLVDGTVRGTGTLSGGVASVRVGPFTGTDRRTVTARYLGDLRVAGSDSASVSLTVAEAAPSPSIIDVRLDQDELRAGRDSARLDVTVSAEDGAVPTGQVRAIVDGKVIDTANLSAGAATLRVGPFEEMGTRAVTVEYVGDEAVQPVSVTVSLEVVRTNSRIALNHNPKRVRAERTEVLLAINVSAPGSSLTPTGRALVDLPGSGRLVVDLDDRGRASVRLPVFGSPGRKTVEVTWRGRDGIKAATATEVIVVREGGKRS